MRWSGVAFILAFTALSTCLFGQVVYVVTSDATSSNSSISAYTINAGNGALIAVPGSPFPAGFLPLGLAVDPAGKFVYVTNNFDGIVLAYTINASNGALTAVPGSPFPVGRY